MIIFCLELLLVIHRLCKRSLWTAVPLRAAEHRRHHSVLVTSHPPSIYVPQPFPSKPREQLATLDQCFPASVFVFLSALVHLTKYSTVPSVLLHTKSCHSLLAESYFVLSILLSIHLLTGIRWWPVSAIMNSATIDMAVLVSHVRWYYWFWIIK